MAIDNKVFRLLTLYDRLTRNGIVNRQQTADEFQVSVKSIQRDIAELNHYIENILLSKSKIIFCRRSNGYRLSDTLESKLSKEETLSLMKVLLESRAFSKSDMCLVFDKLLNGLSYEDRKLLNSFYGNEKHHYIETKNSKSLFEILWNVSLAIKERFIINAAYRKVTDETPTNIEIEPVSILFSEYYFYLLAYYHGREYSNPAIFRLDNFESYEVTPTRFTRENSYKGKFEEGEFRKRVQFMNIGQLMTIEFEFWGRSLDAVTDRLPTARVVRKTDDKFTLRAEVYGKGIKMWLLSQGEYLKVTNPPEFVEEMKHTLSLMMQNYQPAL